MRTFPKLKIGHRLAKVAFSKLVNIAYHFIVLDAEGVFLDGRVFEYSFVVSVRMVGGNSSISQEMFS